MRRPKTQAIDARCYELVSEGLRDWEIEQRLGISGPGPRARRHAIAEGLQWPIRRSYKAPSDVASLRREVKRLQEEVSALRSQLAEHRGDELRYMAGLLGELLSLIEAPERLSPEYARRLRRNLQRVGE